MKKLYLAALVFTLLYNTAFLAATEERIKIYAFYTPSHERLVKNWFLPSLQALDEFDLELELWDQSCPSGAFMEHGWIETMHRKVDLIIRGIKENPGKIFIHADVDTQYFNKFADIIRKEMEDCDIAFQKESSMGEFCCGFFACWGNERTLALWEWVKSAMNHQKNDQVCINENLYGANSFGVKSKHLPSNFFGASTLRPGQWPSLWKPGTWKVIIPQHPIMHHANYTIGVDNKIAQMEQVRALVNKRETRKK